MLFSIFLSLNEDRVRTQPFCSRGIVMWADMAGNHFSKPCNQRNEYKNIFLKEDNSSYLIFVTMASTKVKLPESVYCVFLKFLGIQFVDTTLLIS